MSKPILLFAIAWTIGWVIGALLASSVCSLAITPISVVCHTAIGAVFGLLLFIGIFKK